VRKKNLIIILVILLGFTLGYFLSQSGQSNKNTENKEISKSDPDKKILVVLSAIPLVIKSGGDEQDYSKIEKTSLEISYTARKEDLKNVQIQLYIVGGSKYELEPLDGAEIDNEATKKKGVTVLRGPEAKMGETKKVGINLLSREPGEASINADVISDGKTGRSNTVKIKIN
jgi:hypothetical protein